MVKTLIVFIFAVSFLACSGIISIVGAAEIVYVEGNVQVQTPQDKAWRKVEKGKKVNIGDSIRTARKSIADLVLDEAKSNAIRIDPNTLIVLNSGHAGLIDKLDLSSGKLFAKVESIKSGFTFEVSTPSAVVGVRGTAWGVTCDKKSDGVAVFEKGVYIKTFDEQKKLISEIAVPEGLKTSIERFEAPGELIPVSFEEMEEWDKVKQEISRHVEDSGKKETASVEKVSEQLKSQEEIMEEVNEAKEATQEETERQLSVEDYGGH